MFLPNGRKISHRITSYNVCYTKLLREDSDAYRALGNSNTDWQDEIYRTALSTDHNLTISGGLKNMPYRVSLGYTNQNGIIETSKFERYRITSYNVCYTKLLRLMHS